MHSIWYLYGVTQWSAFYTSSLGRIVRNQVPSSKINISLCYVHISNLNCTRCFLVFSVLYEFGTKMLKTNHANMQNVKSLVYMLKLYYRLIINILAHKTGFSRFNNNSGKFKTWWLCGSELMRERGRKW